MPRPAGPPRFPRAGARWSTRRFAGTRLNLAALEPGPGLAASLGRSIAQIHELRSGNRRGRGTAHVQPEAYRQRRLAELDAAAQTGRVPPALAGRWEERLEDVAWWRFEPTPIHASLGEHQVVVADGAVAGIVGWAEARVADPADDLAWLLASATPEAADSVIEAYSVGRRELRDPHLVDRARLAAELALARWLMHGIRTEQPEVVDDAVDMLADLEALLTEARENSRRLVGAGARERSGRKDLASSSMRSGGTVSPVAA